VKANNVGEVEIFFTKPMQVVRNLTLFHLPQGFVSGNSTEVKLETDQGNSTVGGRRRLQEE